MFRAMLRGMLAHRVRLTLTALAITFGTGFMSASFVFTATLNHSLGSLFAQASAGIDVIVQHAAPGGAVTGAGSGSTQPIAQRIAARIRALPDVAAVDSAVSGRAVLLGRNGKPLPGQFVVALSWPSDAPFQAAFTSRTGSPPAGPGQVGSIDVKAAPGTSAQQLRDQIAQILPAGIVAVTAASAAATQAHQLNSQLGILTYFFLGFAGVALFVGAFVIWNTFSIMIGQRTRELALLRALGAGRGQVFRSVLTEAALVGAVAALAGVGLGILLSRGLAALLAGFGVSLPVAWLVGLPLTRLPGRAGALARGNTMRNPKRTSATAAALMIGLTLIIAAAVLISSSRALISEQISGASQTSFYVQTTNTDTGLSPGLARVLAGTPGVQAVTEVRTTDATVAGTAHRNVDGVDPAAIAAFTDLGIRSGTVTGLTSGGLLVSSAAAASHHWRPGDKVRIQFGAYAVRLLPIDGIFANVGPLTDYLLSNAAFTADTGRGTDTVDLVKAPPSARQSIQQALTGYPGAQLLDQAGYSNSRGAMLASILNLITALLILAIIIALLGIVNTLALSIAERTRELGLLRAIGMRRSQLAQMIAAESVIIAVIGAVLGAVLGLGLGTALAAALTRSQHVTVAIPVTQMVIYIIAAAAAGVLAAIAPARRAARL